MTLYETVFARRAVRKYAKEPLDEATLNDIQNRLNGLKQLSGVRAKFEIVPGSAVKDTSAPHYILAYCADETAEYINVGWCLAEMDLYVQSLGLGACFLGMAKPKDKEAAEGCAVMLSFGKTDAPQRAGEADFKRLKLSKVTNADNAVTHAARLAPSAVNSQPWRIEYSTRTVTAQYVGRGLLKAILKKKMSKIDVGIVSKYIALALSKRGSDIIGIFPNTETESFSVEISYR